MKRNVGLTPDDNAASLGKTWWRTCPDLFAALDARFSFVLDACAAPVNALCDRFWTVDDDALTQDWRVGGYVFCNWPFSRATNNPFAQKMADEARKGAQIVALGPAAPNAQHWHTLTGACDEVWCFDGRLGYGDPVTGEIQKGPPFESALYVFHGGPPPVWGPYLGRISTKGVPHGSGADVWRWTRPYGVTR